MSGPTLSRLDLVINIRFPSARANGLQVAAMAESLSATGLNVAVVVPRRFRQDDTDPFAFYGVRPTFQVERIASFDTIDIVPARWQRVPFLVQSASFAWRVLARAGVARDTGFLVRDHYTLDILVSGLRERDLGRVACEVHNLPQRPSRRRWLMDSLRKLPAVITISDALRDDLLAEGLDPDRVMVARDGVFLKRFAGLPGARVARRELKLDPQRPLVVYAGQLFAWKGVDTLVAAMGAVPDAQLMVVGGGHRELPRLRALAAEHCAGRVTFAGQVPSTDVPFHLAAADVIALPNTGTLPISARYTSPLKLFEAMASQRPIVASDLPSLGEVLTHDRNAHLVTPDDPAALAAGIRALLDDPARAARLAGQARDDVEPYDWSARGRLVARFLRDRLRVGRSLGIAS